MIPVLWSYEANRKNTPPCKSIDVLVTVLTAMASGKIEFLLIPKAVNSSVLMTVNWAPVSNVPTLALAWPAPVFF